jgi:hypothetical protein
VSFVGLICNRLYVNASRRFAATTSERNPRPGV